MVSVASNLIAASSQAVSQIWGRETAGFLVQVVVSDLAGHEGLLLEPLLKLSGVSDIRSNFPIQAV